MRSPEYAATTATPSPAPRPRPPAESWLELADRWTLTELPSWNRRILARAQPATRLVDALNREVLSRLPPPTDDRMSPDQARQLIVHLGLYGSSVARHLQEHSRSLRGDPARSLRDLLVGPERIPFRRYFSGVAHVTGSGHPGRDTYASLVRWNTPTVAVTWNGHRISTLPGAFADGHTRTYTGDPGERAFLELLKKAEAIELAANRLLRFGTETPVTSADSVDRVTAATGLLAALHRLNLDFAAASGAGSLNPAHFTHVLHQFAVHWSTGDIPPSGAQDPEYLKRDFILGINFPGYQRHVRRQFPALLAAERESLNWHMSRPSLPSRLLREIGTAPERLIRMRPGDLRSMLRAHPQLAAHYFLLRANARVAGSHLILAKKFLFTVDRPHKPPSPKHEPVVPNTAGATGMREKLLERLTRARRAHPLAVFGRLPPADITRLTGTAPPPAPPGEETLTSRLRPS